MGTVGIRCYLVSVYLWAFLGVFSLFSLVNFLTPNLCVVILSQLKNWGRDL